MRGNALLTVAEMGRADALAIEQGTPGIALMEAAGQAIARSVMDRHRPQPTAVLCGPGNNGGDGFVVARLLNAAGWPVRIGLLGSRERLRGDAALAAAAWSGPVEPCGLPLLDDGPLVIDALFGAGLARPLDGTAAEIVSAVAARALTSIAVDMPSGVNGDTGEIWGAAASAALTVTFFRKKPGHVLYPGRGLCGDVIVADIGIPEGVLDEIAPSADENGPELWGVSVRPPAADSHKYSRGHALIWGGGPMTGAARLAAQAARRAGAGLVTVAASADGMAIYAGGDPGNIVAPEEDWEGLLADPRITTVLIGPGAGRTDSLKQRVLGVLATQKSVVLDADALSVFGGDLDSFCDAAHAKTVLTPHEGEFARLFPDLSGDKVTRARTAAQTTGAVVLLKGADTVVAGPDGQVALNTNAPVTLATAGSGDVLAGIVAALLAKETAAFPAAAAGAWLHGAAAATFGLGLVAEDIVSALPRALTALPS